MSIFKSTPVSSNLFKQKSNEILSVFTATQVKLTELVNQQLDYLKGVDDQIKVLEKEKSETELNVQENQAVINKITDFLK